MQISALHYQMMTIIVETITFFGKRREARHLWENGARWEKYTGWEKRDREGGRKEITVRKKVAHVKSFESRIYYFFPPEQSFPHFFPVS